METIPLVESPDVAQPDGAVLEGGAAPPLAVEPLEDRVLLAADAATPPADVAPPTAPAPYIAAEHAAHPTIDLGDAIEATNIASDAAQSAADGSSVQSPAQHPTHGEAELVENKADNAEKPEQSKNEFDESGPHRNEFGLATIEPETGAAEMVRSPHDRRLLEEKEFDEPDAAEPRSTEAGGAPLADATVAIEVAVQEVAGELDKGLIKAAGVEPQIELAPSNVASGAAATSSDASEHSDVLVQTVLKAAPVAPTVASQVMNHDADEEPVPEEANIREAASVVSPAADSGHLNVEPQQHAEVLRDLPVDTPLAVDALFEDGSGVEAVLAPARNA